MIELGSFVLLKELVKSSLAVTFAYEGVVSRELETGVLGVLEVEVFQVSHDMKFVYRRGDSRYRTLETFFQQLLIV